MIDCHLVSLTQKTLRSDFSQGTWAGRNDRPWLLYRTCLLDQPWPWNQPVCVGGRQQIELYSVLALVLPLPLHS